MNGVLSQVHCNAANKYQCGDLNMNECDLNILAKEVTKIWREKQCYFRILWFIELRINTRTSGTKQFGHQPALIWEALNFVVSNKIGYSYFSHGCWLRSWNTKLILPAWNCTFIRSLSLRYYKSTGFDTVTRSK